MVHASDWFGQFRGKLCNVYMILFIHLYIFHFSDIILQNSEIIFKRKNSFKITMVITVSDLLYSQDKFMYDGPFLKSNTIKKCISINSNSRSLYFI